MRKWRGLSTLVTETVHGVSRVVERVQKQTAERPFNVLKQIPPLAAPASGIHALHDATVSTVHATVRLINRAVGATLHTVIHWSQQMSEQEVLNIVKEARTIAVYGMQDESRADAAAYRIPAGLKQRGYQIYPVNPHIKSALGLTAYARLADLPVKVDILEVFRRADALPALADEIIALPDTLRPTTVWLQSGITHAAAEQKLHDAGFKVVADRCLGVDAARASR